MFIRYMVGEEAKVVLRNANKNTISEVGYGILDENSLGRAGFSFINLFVASL